MAATDPSFGKPVMPLSSKPAAGQHPRLLFTAADLPKLRERAQHGLRAKVLARLRESCARLMDPRDPSYLDFRERRRANVWQFRKGIFTVVPALDALAVGYAFTGEAAIGDFARDALMTIIEERLADVPSLAWGMTTHGWRHGPGHDKANFAQALCWVYDFCYDRFSAAQRERVIAYAKECMALANEQWSFDWWQIANNRGSRAILGNTLLALTLEGDTEVPRGDFYIQDGVYAVEHYLFLAHDEGGAPFEGPGYAGSISFIATAAEALRRRGKPNLLTNDRFERFLDYMLYELLPGGGSVNNLNDCTEGTGTITGNLPVMGEARGALLPWLARQLDLHPARIGAWLEAPDPQKEPTGGAALLPYLLWWKEDAPARTPEELGYPLSHFFAGRGVASMRTGWAADDWLVTHFCGRQQYKCHRQGDFNHVALCALGEKFLVDAGYGQSVHTGDMTKPMDRWFGRTDAHNCVVVDGQTQRGTIENLGWPEGKMLDWQHSEAFDTTLGDASLCFGPDHRVRRALRRVVFVRQGPAPYLAILDVNEKDGRPFTADCLWHTDPANRVSLEENRFVIQGQKNSCAAAVLWPLDARPELADSYGRPQVRLSLNAPVVETLTVFCPRRAGEPAPRFSCRRDGDASFSITCDLAGRASVLRLSVATEGPFRKPAPVRLQAR